jgi:hypothetical protein
LFPVTRRDQHTPMGRERKRLNGTHPQMSGVCGV